jgi:uncharacterized DUF497 family protein
MNHDLFDWDNVNIAHIALHHVVPDETEEALTLAPIELDYETVNGEERDRLIGLTAKGRLIAVVITVRYDKIRVVTAYPATRSQQRIYFKSAGYKYD